MHKRLATRSKKLSWLLRHGAVEAGIDMDAAGWVSIDDVLALVELSFDELEIVVRENSKQRLQVDGARMRACQGHSTETMPVTRAALEASWDEYAGDGSLWHGTSLAALPSIGETGLNPAARTHVHLADDVSSRVGKRANVHVLLEISPAKIRAAGQGIWQAPNGVVLTRVVHRDAIIDLAPVSRRARREEAALRAIFGFSHRADTSHDPERA